MPPYPGLSALTEDDAGIFFGREANIMAGITELRQKRKRRAPRFLVMEAASGAQFATQSPVRGTRSGSFWRAVENLFEVHDLGNPWTISAVGS